MAKHEAPTEHLEDPEIESMLFQRAPRHQGHLLPVLFAFHIAIHINFRSAFILLSILSGDMQCTMATVTAPPPSPPLPERSRQWGSRCCKVEANLIKIAKQVGL